MRFINLSWLCVVFLSVGCAQLRRSDDTSTDVKEIPTTTGKAWDNDNGVPADSSPLKSMQPPKPKKVGVIVGPGGAKALAAATVLKELNRARVPIHGIVGIEWGALVAGLYAHKAQAHEMEWKLYKLERQPLPGSGFLTSKIKPEKISTLRNFLEDAFAGQEIPHAALKFTCPIQSVKTGEWRWPQSGSMARNIESCMGYPPLYDPNPSDNMAAAFAVEGAIEKLKSQGAEVIVLINVLNSGALLDQRQWTAPEISAILWLEIRRSLRLAASSVDHWIEVDTSKVAMSDFQKRKELFAAGEKAGQLAAEQLIKKFGF